MSFLIILWKTVKSRIVKPFFRQLRRNNLFFGFLLAGFVLTGCLSVFFNQLRLNRDIYFAQRYTGFYVIVKHDYQNYTSRTSAREEYFFAPKPLEAVLDRLAIGHSVRLRTQAMLYIDDPDEMELKDGRSIMLIGCIPKAELSILSGLELKGKLPTLSGDEAVLLTEYANYDYPQAYIIQRMSSFGFPFGARFIVTGQLDTQGADSSLYGSIMLADRQDVVELVGLENDLASEIILDRLNIWQKFFLTIALGREYRLVHYTEVDELAQAVNLVSEGLRWLLIIFIVAVISSAITNTLIVSFANRSSEIALLRSCGYSNHLILFLYCLEYAGQLFVAWLLGSGISAGLALAFNKLEIKAININLEIAFAGREILLKPKLSDFTCNLLFFLAILLTVIIYRLGGYLKKTSLAS